MDAKTLRKMTVVELREEAKKIPGVTGVSGMKKDQLVELVAKHLGVDLHEHGVAPATIDKAEIKRRIRQLKQRKQEALAAADRKAARACNRQIHRYKHLLRKMARAA